MRTVRRRETKCRECAPSLRFEGDRDVNVDDNEYDSDGMMSVSSSGSRSSKNGGKKKGRNKRRNKGAGKVATAKRKSGGAAAKAKKAKR